MWCHWAPLKDCSYVQHLSESTKHWVLLSKNFEGSNCVSEESRRSDGPADGLTGRLASEVTVCVCFVYRAFVMYHWLWCVRTIWTYELIPFGLRAHNTCCCHITLCEGEVQVNVFSEQWTRFRLQFFMPLVCVVVLLPPFQAVCVFLYWQHLWQDAAPNIFYFLPYRGRISRIFLCFLITSSAQHGSAHIWDCFATISNIGRKWKVDCLYIHKLYEHAAL